MAIMTRAARIGLAWSAALALAPAFAAEDSAAGNWKTIDDETGKPASIVKIVDTGGELRGTVEKILREGADPNEKCDKCSGELKDKPVVGMTILKGFHRQKDGNVYEGGTVLDPHNGKTYKGKITVEDGGQKLSLRGYIGIELIGRSQTWTREP